MPTGTRAGHQPKGKTMSVTIVTTEHLHVLVWAGLQRQRPAGDLHWTYGNPPFRKLSVCCGRLCCCEATRRQSALEVLLGAPA